MNSNSSSAFQGSPTPAWVPELPDIAQPSSQLSLPFPPTPASSACSNLLPIPSSTSSPSSGSSGRKAPRKRQRNRKSVALAARDLSSADPREAVDQHAFFDDGVDFSFHDHDNDILGAQETLPTAASSSNTQLSETRQLPVDTPSSYSNLIFTDKFAYCARIDRSCWVLEDCAMGLPLLGSFYHVTLYEGLNADQIERLTTCDCTRGRGGLDCLHQQAMRQDTLRFKEEVILCSELVSHELFNSYSSQLSASPTPFTAFCTTTQQAYEQHSPNLKTKFLARSTFVKLYFAYVRIQQLEVSFSRPQCGPNPSTVIADGIVLAYSSNLTHARLSPPTTVGPDINTNARAGTVTPFLPPVSVRRAARAFCRSLKTVDIDHAQLLKTFSTNLHSALPTFPGPIALWARQYEQLLFVICLAPSLPSSLELVLHNLIDQFCANEGVFQLCRPSIAPLLLSLAEMSASQASTERYIRLGTSLARRCPFLGNVVLAFTSPACQSHHSLLVDLHLLMRATVDVINYQLSALHPRATPPPSSSPTQLDIAPYTQTGSHYGSAKCRSRPTYPHLNEGKDGRSGEKQAGQEQDQDSSQHCRKFYDEYVKRKRTGGLMALWCTHRLCVGFHVIPQSEGRNDVFSAIYCHWPIAPSVIVYDFACQLGPYSLRREPDYFKDTLFVVDQMHEKGHTDCSASSRLSTYMRNDPQLQHVYSSAAECGNAGLARIKKTVSYSKQEHAVALVRVFLSIWNRRRIRDAQTTSRTSMRSETSTGRTVEL
ncbi:hypothetical protein A4X03_0g7774 [Tilletia caries]|uniref:HMG domain-containing protein n=1 Tax=Tilletia caries TaxID=13290 RepID=A0A8T8SML1_9BASI|nr:hypothetical protein A4X03_0g7774 [Tilletia caries]